MALTEAPHTDDEARIFYELYGPLRRFAAVVGPIEVDPDDLLQEAVAGVLRHRQLTDLDHPAAYLRRAILNLAANERRRFSRTRRAIARMGPTPGGSHDVYPSDLAELMWLTPRDRAVLYLSEIEGYRYAEIGQMLNCTEVAARKRALRARQRLHAAIVGEVADG